MSIETALYTKMHDAAALEALVGTRIYPIVLPQSPAFPAVAYRRSGGQPISLLATDTNIIEGRFEVAAFAKTYDQCLQVANEIRIALQRTRGTVSGVEILDITIDNIDQTFEQDFEIHEITTDITVSYRV